MSKVLITPAKLDALVDAYNALTGNTSQLTLADLATAIADIQMGDPGEDLQKLLENAGPFDITNSASKISDYAFKDKALRTGTFPEAASIGFSAFENCTALTDVSAPKSAEISTSGFYYCTALTDISMPLCTSVGKNAFYHCDKLKTVDLPKCTYIGETAFNGCYLLETVDISSAKELVRQCFQDCKALKTLELPASVQVINYQAFYGSGLEKLIFRNSTSVPVLGSNNVFNSTPIKAGTGYIYVPDTLLSDWKAATNWATYSAQIKGISELSE